MRFRILASFGDSYLHVAVASERPAMRIDGATTSQEIRANGPKALPRQTGDPSQAVVEAERLKRRNAELEAQMLALAEANSALRSYVADAAHELVEPLVIVEGVAVELMRELTGYARSQLDTVAMVAARSRLLVESLLYDARLEQRAPEVRTVDLAAIVDDAVKLVTVGPQGGDVRISIGPMPTLVSNPELLSIVIRNLLGNAVKHGSGTVAEVSVTADPQPEGWRLSVISRGTPISPRDGALLLRRFERGAPADRTAGVGLGLAICQRIVERLGGTIGIAPVLPAGNRFFVVLPAAD
jgi:signal transduction histidine kinase